MKTITLAVVVSLFAVLPLQASMARVVEVLDGRTVVVEQDNLRRTITVAGVAVLDPTRAAELLRWTLLSEGSVVWVLIEAHPRGGHLIYRSPDALFVNRELVIRGFAKATEYGIEAERNLRVTYLGQVDPARWVSVGQSGRGSDTSRRSSASRTPSARSTARGNSPGRSSPR